MLRVRLLHGFLALAGAGPGAAQDAAPRPAAEVAPAPDALLAASPEARALWERLCAATKSSAPGPITAFRLKAEVLQRQGAGTNELDIDYRYLAPDCIRFALPGRRETGRSGMGREDYWLKDGEEVVVLAGRDYAPDRRQVDEMHALARNYVALSDPSRLALRRLELLPAPPRDLPPNLVERARKLAWLVVASPDFALVRRDGEPAKDALYVVEIGAAESGLPELVVIREEPRPARAGDVIAPLLVELGNYREVSGFRIPNKLLVRAQREDRRAFVESPSQEIYVTEVDLAPKLARADFQP